MMLKKFESIDVLRFPLVVLVVFVHVIPEEIHPVQLSGDLHKVYTLLSELISHNLGRIAVPCFFLFSGYFFFLKMQSFNARYYTEQLRKRWRTLLIPFLAWNVLFVLAVLVKNSVFTSLGLAEDDLLMSLQQSPWQKIIWAGPFLFPLWYLRDLICMTILSPAFFLLFRYTGGWGVLLLIAVYLTTWEVDLPGFSTTAFLFFGAGAFMGMYKYDLMAVGEKYKSWIFLAAVVLLGIATCFNGTPQYEYWIRAFVLSGVAAVLCIGHMLAKTSRLKAYLVRLSPAVFFIYAVHSLYIINWLKGAFANSPFSDSGWWKILAYFCIPMLCVLISMGLYGLMKRFFPGALAFLTGGRTAVQSKNRVHEV